MSNFDELFQALNSRKAEDKQENYLEAVEKGINILTKAARTLKNLDGEKFEGRVQIEQTVDRGRNAAFMVRVEGKPEFALWFGDDGKSIDFAPQSMDSKMVYLKEEDAEKFESAFEGLAQVARDRDAALGKKYSNPIEELLRGLGDNKATPEEEKKWSEEIAACVAAIKHLNTSNKWDEVSAYWDDNMTMVCRKGLQIAFRKHGNTWFVSYNENFNVADMKAVSDDLGNLLTQVDKLVKEELPNELAKLGEGPKMLKELFSAMPSDLRDEILKGLAKRLGITINNL